MRTSSYVLGACGLALALGILLVAAISPSWRGSQLPPDPPRESLAHEQRIDRLLGHFLESDYWDVSYQIRLSEGTMRRRSASQVAAPDLWQVEWRLQPPQEAPSSLMCTDHSAPGYTAEFYEYVSQQWSYAARFFPECSATGLALLEAVNALHWECDRLSSERGTPEASIVTRIEAQFDCAVTRCHWRRLDLRGHIFREDLEIVVESRAGDYLLVFELRDIVQCPPDAAPRKRIWMKFEYRPGANGAE